MFVWFKKRAVFVLPPLPQDSTHSTVGWHLALAVYYMRKQEKMLFIDKRNHQSEASLKKEIRLKFNFILQYFLINNFNEPSECLPNI